MIWRAGGSVRLGCQPKGSRHLPRDQLGPVVPRGTNPEPTVFKTLPCRGWQSTISPLPHRFPLWPEHLRKEEGRGEPVCERVYFKLEKSAKVKLSCSGNLEILLAAKFELK